MSGTIYPSGDAARPSGELSQPADRALEAWAVVRARGAHEAGS
jgi:hypothetical protein